MADDKLRCFVVMGFGEKTDFATGRKLDLNKSYQYLIKPAVESRGIECVRADEIRHSGAIDVPMYEQLLAADLVIADLSTANMNALYELGVRHALKPRTTIVVAESKLPYPFDLNHTAIMSYTHLGEAIDIAEAMRFQKELGALIDAVVKQPKTDSPVYTYLHRLTPPAFPAAVAEAAAAAAGSIAAPAAPGAAPAPARSDVADPSLALLIERGEEALKLGQFPKAQGLFSAALDVSAGADAAGGAIRRDPYLLQRLALATYKAKIPDAVGALNEALRILEPLDPKESNDPETVGLAGAIEKRLFDAGMGDAHLENAIQYYQRGFLLKNDWYNGINVAFLLNVRADSALDANDDDRVADLVWANRVRRKVLALCVENLAAIERRSVAAPAAAAAAAGDALTREQAAQDRDTRFWALATKAEALYGLGDLAGFDREKAAAEAVAPASWMIDSFLDQIGRLRALLERRGGLLTPPWPGAAAAPGGA